MSIYDNSSCISRLFFAWMRQFYSSFPYSGGLPEIPAEFSSQNLTTSILLSWNLQLKSANPRLFFCLVSQYFSKTVPYALCYCVTSICYLGMCVLFGYLLEYLENEQAEVWEGCVLAGSISIVSVVSIVMHHRYYYRMHVLGGSMRYSILSLIYNHILTLNNAQVRQVSVGNILTMASADLHFCDLVLMFASFLWITPVYAVLNGCLLYWYIGISGIFGLVTLCLVIPLQAFFSRLFTQYHKRSSDITSTRLEAMTELISYIRPIKIHCLEPDYMTNIQGIRKSEMRYIRKTGLLRASNMIIFFCSQGIVSLVTFGSYVAMGNTLKSDVIFPSLALLTNAQYFICIALQFGMEFLAEVYGACDRVHRLLKERNERSRENSLEADANIEQDENEEKYAIRMNGVSGYWGGDDPTQSVINFNLKPVHNKQDSMTSLTDRIERAYTSRSKFSSDSKRIHPKRRFTQVHEARRSSISAGLAFFSDLKLDRVLPISSPSIPNTLESVPGVLTNICISFPSNKLTVITGPVGSGKSLLINVLLKELPIQQGTVSISGSISYYDSNPCMINSTIRENILFGKEYNAEKYEEVVDWCGLGLDFGKFPRGDETEVGEKGTSLSGGQRARIALARTLYSDGDIMILDDPLSALDANLTSHILHNCLKSMSRYKTVILVTHSKAALGCADWLIVMNSGRVSYLGTPQDYMKEDRIESDIIDKNQAPTEEISERDDNSGSEIISLEEKSSNSVSFQTYWGYINSGLLNSWSFPVIVILSLLAQGAYLSIPLWLGYWADAFDQDDLYYLETFCILVSALILLSTLRNHFFYQSLLSSNSSIHSSVLNNLLHARCSFYDTNPSGRILNRVGQDMNRMDSELPYVMVDLVQVFGIVVGLVLVTIIINPIMIVVCTILLLLSIYTYRKAIPITRDLRRAESLKASELQSLFISTIDSLVTIRSLSAQAFFQHKMQTKLHEAMSAYFWYVSSARWMNFRLDLIAALFSAFTSFAAVANKGLYGSGYVGASLVFSLQIVSYVVWMVRQLGETENTMTSTERVMQYQNIEQEGELNKGEIEITQGKVKFDRVWMKYQEGLEPALRNVSFEVSGKKIGIVGRSGSGKSTILQVLMRLSEIYEGSICIDGVEISRVGLHDLRKNIAVISQNPFLMQTTIRKNLDITHSCSDDEILNALHKVKLSNLLSSHPNKIDTVISDLNLSQGQKQLLCLARVLLNKKKILILDEATASIDTSHEALIRKILNSAFSDCTIIEIAHKPSGILDAENVLILENGAVKDLARTEDLLKDPESVISRMLSNK